MNYKEKQLKDKGGFINRLFKVKSAAAILIGKTLIAATRVLGRGGTTLPGRIAQNIEPSIVSGLAAQTRDGSLVITGTNGKTTTAALITGILKESGFSYIHNQSGSNMSWGVTTALVGAASITGKIRADYAVMEVDEGAFPGVTLNLKPRVIVVTNIFRDQLDRYGEIDRIQDAIRQGLKAQPAEGYQVINADDPSLVALAGGDNSRRLTYGLDIELNTDYGRDSVKDLKTCRHCGKELAYERIYYAHLGHFYCPNCGYSRPEPDIKLTGYSKNRSGSARLEIQYPGGLMNFNFPLLGIYNLYNVLAAAACALSLQLDPLIISTALEKSTPAFGRMEQFTYRDKRIVMALIKNPVGANEVMRTVLNEEGKISLMVAINDKIADGTDVSWLWDVDFEQLASISNQLSVVTASGLRAWDMGVRFKYAGISTDEITVTENTAEALHSALAATDSGNSLFILPSYTAMLELRRHLNRMGLGKPYWEDR
ncbi:MAG: DUF1727 domain-containing protein [Firmicutes bacterium]|nr:DUF1727 domain-containing protein [Bacillota bacterium]